MFQTIKLSEKGQIAIPKKFRQKLQLKEDAQLYMTEKDGKLIVGKVSDLKIDTDVSWVDTELKKQIKAVWDNPTDEKTWSKYK